MATRDRVAARRLLLRRLIGKHPVNSQEELVELLSNRGHRVTQTTVSRDLAALDVVKIALPDGGEQYGFPTTGAVDRDADPRLVRMLREFVTEIDHSGNLVVVKTAPGAAHPVASALDATPPDGVLGTVAGDDTILIVATSASDNQRNDPASGQSVARTLERLMEARPR